MKGKCSKLNTGDKQAVAERSAHAKKRAILSRAGWADGKGRSQPPGVGATWHTTESDTPSNSYNAR